MWKLAWHGLTVPVPALAYTRIFFTGNTDDLMLVTSDHQFLSIDRAHELGRQAARRMPLLKALWGKHATEMEAMLFGFTVTPSDLTCATTTHLQKQLRASVALTLKAMAAPFDIVAAHRMSGWKSGLLKYGHASKGNDVYLYLLQNDPDAAPYDVRYRVTAANKGSRRAALLIAHPGKASYEPSPAWLRRLHAYLEDPSSAHLRNLTSALRKAGFSGDDIDQLAKRRR